jgi:hypothetical protein
LPQRKILSNHNIRFYQTNKQLFSHTMNSLLKLLASLLLVAALMSQAFAASAAAPRSAGSSLTRRTTLVRFMETLHVFEDIPDDVRINIVLNMEGF